MEISGRKVTGKLAKNCKYKLWISAMDILLVISVRRGMDPPPAELVIRCRLLRLWRTFYAKNL